VNRCLDEDINVFKHTIQDVVDELEVRVAAIAQWLMYLRPGIPTWPRCLSCLPHWVPIGDSFIAHADAEAPVTVQEARRRCKVATHKALVTRLLFILTRCSRLVVPEEPSPAIDSTALYTQVPVHRIDCQMDVWNLNVNMVRRRMSDVPQLHVCRLTPIKLARRHCHGVTRHGHNRNLLLSLRVCEDLVLNCSRATRRAAGGASAASR